METLGHAQPPRSGENGPEADRTGEQISDIAHPDLQLFANRRDRRHHLQNGDITLHSTNLESFVASVRSLKAHKRSDMLVVGFFVVHETSKRYHAETDSDYDLVISIPGRGEISLDFPELPHNERNGGQRDEYTLLLAPGVDIRLHHLDPRVFSMRAARENSDDAWLPSRVQVTALLVDGSKHLLIDRHWPQQYWFSTQADDGEEPGDISRPQWNLAVPVP